MKVVTHAETCGYAIYGPPALCTCLRSNYAIPDRLRIGRYTIDPGEPCATCGQPLGADCHAAHAAFVHFACEHQWLEATARSGKAYRVCRICRATSAGTEPVSGDAHQSTEPSPGAALSGDLGGTRTAENDSGGARRTGGLAPDV